MKKTLCSLMLVFIISTSSVFSQQYPCPSEVKIDNGSGSCPDLNGMPVTGSIKLGGLDPNNIPTIVKIYDVTDPNNEILITDIFFGPGTQGPNGYIDYCYYVGPSNNNNLQGGGAKFRVEVMYGTTPCGGVLPVTLVRFEATRSGQTVSLLWQTVSEKNSKGFFVQRQTSAGWQDVGFIPTRAQNGNSDVLLSYEYQDPNNFKGISLYRLRQVDRDNTQAFSVIRSVRSDKRTVPIIVYPNPGIAGKIQVSFGDIAPRKVTVTEVGSGRIIQHHPNVTSNYLLIEKLPKGLYAMKILWIETREEETMQFIIQ